VNVPTKIWLYRITHIKNLNFILRNGIYTSGSTNFDPNYIKIGDPSLINYRKNLDARNPPGGKLSDYIPFYLGPRSPMLYQIALGYEDIAKYSQEDIIYLISSFDQVKSHNLTYFFTDGNARSETTTTYVSESDFSLLDWDTIYGTYWKSDETDLLRKQKKQSELLIKDHLPVSCIDYIGVFNNTAKQNVLHLLKELNLNIPIKVSPAKLYYDNL
jgi:hypothetical protein